MTTTLHPIDRDSFEPPYLQVAQRLRERVMGGEFQPGDRLPSEAELCAAYGVSRMTARRALTQLIQGDVAYAEHGRGTFVKSPQLGAATFDLTDLRRHLADPEMAARILEARIASPSQRVQQKLRIGPRERVICIRRLLSRGRVPVFYHSEYLVFDPVRPLVEAELEVTSLDGLLSGGGGSGLRYGRLRLHASMLTEAEARRLGEDQGTPAWVVEHLFYGAGDRPESWGRFVCRADGLVFDATVGLVTPGSLTDGDW